MPMLLKLIGKNEAVMKQYFFFCLVEPHLIFEIYLIVMYLNDQNKNKKIIIKIITCKVNN